MNDLIKKGKKVFTFTVVLTTIVWSIGIGALALPLAANAVTSGDLIKGTGTAVYYYGADAKRYVFPYQAAYTSWYTGFGTVTTMTDADLIAVPFGGNVTVHPGKLLQVVSMDSPWAVMDPKVYAVSKGGVLHWVKTAALASGIFGAAWEGQIVAVPESLLTNYTIGTEINNASDYSLATQLAVATINEDKGLTGAGGGVTISLASDTPMSASIPNNAANVNFTYLNLTAGPAGATVTGLKVTRSGLGADANIAAVKLFIDGVQRGTSQSLGSLHQATFSLSSNPIVIAAGATQKVVIAADITLLPVTFDQHILGIANSADVITTAVVGGTFPVNGNVMSLVNTNIGTATVTSGPLNPTNGGAVDADAVGYRFSQVKITSGAVEPIVLDQLTAIKNGTAANTDIKNIVLYNDTSGAVLGTAASLDSNGRAVFSNLNIQIAKGGNVLLSIKADVAGGSGRTLGFDVHDGTAFTIMVKGATYNFGITPAGAVNFCVPAFTDFTCPRQNINQGYLTISKSPSAPATGKIGVGASAVPVMAFDYVVAGEPVNVTRTVITYTVNAAAKIGNFTNWTLYKADGTVLAGPKNRDTALVIATDTVTFTDSYTLPVGTTTVWLKTDVSSAGVALDTIFSGMALSTITAKGANSGKTTWTTSGGPVIPPASNIVGNVMTLQGPALAVTTAATPIASTIVANAQDQAFAYVDLDASGGGENIRVSQVVVTDTMGGPAVLAEIQNLELWGDPDNTDTTAVNVRLTTSNSTTVNAATVTFTFQTPIIVSKTATSRLTLKADVDGTVVTPFSTHRYNAAAGSVTATGKDTGNNAALTYAGLGQPQTLQANGRLTVARAADMPVAAQLVSSSTNNSVMKYKFSATWEPVDVTTIPFFIGINYAYPAHVGNVGRVYLYVDGVLTGNTAGYTFDPTTGMGNIVLNSGTLVIPKDGYKNVEFRIDVSPKDQVTPDGNADGWVNVGGWDEFYFGIGDAGGTWATWGGAGNYSVIANGQSSGVTIPQANIDDLGTGAGNVWGGNAYTIHKGILTVSLNSGSPQGTQTAGAGKDVLKLNLVATGDDITVTDLQTQRSGTAVVAGPGNAKWCNDAATMTYWDFLGAGNWLGLPTLDTAVMGTPANVLQIGAGSTAVVKLNGDTTGATNPNTLQYTVNGGGWGFISGVVWNDSSLANVDLLTTKNLPVNGGAMSY